MNSISYRCCRFPPVIIQQAVWLYYRFTLSFRDVEDFLAERGIEVSYETIRRWVIRFGPQAARRLERFRPKAHCQWHLDEGFVSIGGKRMCLWRAVDQEGEVLDVVVQSRRNKRVALKLIRKLLKRQGFAPCTVVTDKYPAYSAAFREVGLTAIRHRGKCRNNRAESPHVPIRRRERKMQGFRSAGSARRFLSAHDTIHNTFNTRRHRITAAEHRTLRDHARSLWHGVTAAAA